MALHLNLLHEEFQEQRQRQRDPLKIGMMVLGGLYYFFVHRHMKAENESLKAQLKRLGWWDTANTLGLHFTFGPEPVLNAFFNQTPPDSMKNNYAGYGFSFVFKKSMWEKAPFPHVEYASDYGFVAAATAKGCRLDHFADTKGLCLHILRKDNMSRSFPQHLLPEFMLQTLFPADLSALLER